MPGRALNAYLQPFLASWDKAQSPEAQPSCPTEPFLPPMVEGEGPSGGEGRRSWDKGAGRPRPS